MNPPLAGPQKEKYAVAGLCALFALALGAHYGVSDQNLYLLPGIRLANPAFLGRDWYVTQTAQHYAAFTHLVYALQKVGPLPWASGALCLLLKGGVAVGVYATLRALYREPFLPFLVALPLLHLAVGSPKLLSHPFLVPWLIPSVMATALALTGVAALSHAGPDRYSRHALAGALFGLSGLLHGTFLFLVPPFLAGIWVTLPGKFSRREVAAFGIPFLLLTIPVGWTVVSRFDFGESGLQRLDALLRLRAPHHHLPGAWGWEGFSLFAKHTALGAIGLALTWPRTSRAPVVLASAASLTGLFAFVFFSTVIVFVPQVAALQAFHFISLLSCFALLFFAGAVAQEVKDVGPFSAQRRRRLALLAVGLVVVYLTSRIIGSLLITLVGLCLARARFGRSARAHPDFARSVMLCGAALFLTGLGGFCLPLSTAFFKPYDGEPGLTRWVRARTPPKILETLAPARAEYDLFEWVRTGTPPGAIFIVPFEMERFRLCAGRGIVVDWKGFPYRTQDAEEWYRRVTLVSGTRNPASKQEILTGYLGLDAGRARMLAGAFEADYVVVRRRPHTGDLSAFRNVYSNADYAVYWIETPD